MPNAYTRIYIQMVFSPRGRENVITLKHQQTIVAIYCDTIRNVPKTINN